MIYPAIRTAMTKNMNNKKHFTVRARSRIHSNYGPMKVPQSRQNISLYNGKNSWIPRVTSKLSGTNQLQSTLKTSSVGSYMPANATVLVDIGCLPEMKIT